MDVNSHFAHGKKTKTERILICSRSHSRGVAEPEFQSEISDFQSLALMHGTILTEVCVVAELGFKPARHQGRLRGGDNACAEP